MHTIKQSVRGHHALSRVVSCKHGTVHPTAQTFRTRFGDLIQARGRPRRANARIDRNIVQGCASARPVQYSSARVWPKLHHRHWRPIVGYLPEAERGPGIQ
jgi:hypothetical protein